MAWGGSNGLSLWGVGVGVGVGGQDHGGGRWDCGGGGGGGGRRVRNGAGGIEASSSLGGKICAEIDGWDGMGI